MAAIYCEHCCVLITDGCVESSPEGDPVCVHCYGKIPDEAWEEDEE